MDYDWTVVFWDGHKWSVMSNTTEERAKECTAQFMAEGREAYAVSCEQIALWARQLG